MSHAPNDQNPVSAAPANKPPERFAPANSTAEQNGRLTQSAPEKASPPAGLTAAPSVATFWYAFRRCWLLATVVGLCGALLTILAFGFLLPGHYTADALIKVSPSNSESIGEQRIDWKTFRENQKAIVLSIPILNGALNDPKVQELPSIQDSVNPTAWLSKALKVDFKQGPTILRLSMQGDDPQELKTLVNAVANAYAKEARRQADLRRDAVLQNMRIMAGNLQTSIREKSRLLNDLRAQRKIPSPEDANSQIASLLRQGEAANKQMSDLKLSEIGLKSTLQNQLRLKADLKSNPISIVEIDKYLETDVKMKHFRELIAKQDEKIETLRKVVKPDLFTAEASGLIATREKYEEEMNRYRLTREPLVRGKLVREIEHEMIKTKQELDGMSPKQQLIQIEIDSLNKRIERLRNRSMMEDELGLVEGIAQDKKQMQQMQDKIAGLKITSATTGNIRVWQHAEMPNSIDRSRQIKYAASIGFGVFGILLVGVALLEFGRRKIGSPEEVSQGLGIGLMGTLPSLPARSRKPLPAKPTQRDLYWHGIMTESIDAIRTLLLHEARGGNVHAVMVTSAVRKEGKSSVASQLALSLARAWKKTLLVDGDLRSPVVHRLFDQPQEPGLCEVLRGEVSHADAVHSTQMSRLWVMPAGQWDNHAIQALSQDAVRSMFDQLKDKFDIIIVDSGPVLPVADSLALGQHVDAVVLTVLQDVSRAPLIYSAQQRLKSLGVQTLGAVVIGGKSDASGFRPSAK